jgi:lipopolysaccharide/colanic/teichoic acid biosynthesis glycosyltransferase
MIAVINTATACSWVEGLGEIPWALLPVANRPLVDYWLEACTEFGVRSVHIILGDEAKQIEDYIASGSRWNVVVEYIFPRKNETAIEYVRSISNYWKNGLLYFGGPFFMRRRQGFRTDRLEELPTCCHSFDIEPYFMYGKTGDELIGLLDGYNEPNRGLETIHVHPYMMASLNDYFELNMKMVKAEFSRYVTAGFSSKDGSSMGCNVRTPPSSHLQAPILVGDDCRFGAMTTIGPHAVVGNHVIVDAFSELTDCLILCDTYIGRNLEIRNKIVSGNRVIDPIDGTAIQIDDSWLIARNRPELRSEDIVRYIILWCVTLVIAMVQVIPFLLFMPLFRLTGIASFKTRQYHDPHTGYITLKDFGKRKDRKSILYRTFRALSLDRFPRILLALRGRMFLCGQPPMRHPEDDDIIKELKQYYPGVFCYQDYNQDSDRLVDSLWYAHIRSLFEDIKILIKALLSRFITAGRKTSMDRE